MNITVKTDLPDFKLIDKIKIITENKINAYKNFFSNKSYLIIESFAQLAALHVRYKVNFKKHAFLLKINYFESSWSNNFNGNCLLNATLLNLSETSYLYKLIAYKNSLMIAKSELLISTINYNDFFHKEFLKEYYQSLIKCLMKE